MRKILKIEINTILCLICCAENYGYSTLLGDFASMLDNMLFSGEIEEYAKEVEKTEGYGEEDYKDIKEKLWEFKKKYCP